MTPDLRLGRWQDVLSDVECDAVICDPPFGARTHLGASHERFVAAPDNGNRTPVTYGFWSPGDVAEFVASWSPRVRGWIAAMTSHDLCPAWENALDAVGRLCFAPIPCVSLNPPPRMGGDGPTSAAVWLMVARPRTRTVCGSLPGYYLYRRPLGNGGGGGRGKPLDLMRALVKDYSRPGDLVCDPCAGYGTTLRAAVQLGRRAVGAECDGAAYHEACARLALPTNGDLFAEAL